MLTTLRATLASAVLALAHKMAPPGWVPSGSGGTGPFRPK